MGRSARALLARGQGILTAIPPLGMCVVLVLALVMVINNAMPLPVSASDTGWLSPSANSNVGWVNPDYAYSSNNSRAEGNNTDDIVQYYNFSLPTIPSGGTVDGIQVSIEGYQDLVLWPFIARDAEISLSWNGGSSYTSGGAGVKQTSLTTSEATYTFGGATDTWGRTWAPGEFTNAYFRVKLDCIDAWYTMYVDHVQVRVYYHETKPPVITEAVTLYNSGENATVTQMTPQQEYAVKVTVADNSTIDDLNTVTVTVFYDSDGDDASGDIPAANTQVCFVMTCTVGSTPGWSQNPSSSTTWDIVEANCKQPSLTAGSGDFWFHFKPGKVATEATDWDIYVSAVDDGSNSDTWYDGSDYDMLWYGEIDVSGTAPGWGTVLPGMDFGSPSAKESVTVTYISNGNYDAAISTNDWTGTGNTATLNTAGTPGANEFSMKAWSSDNLTAADLVTTSAGDCVIDNTGDLTTESGDANSSNTLYLKLGTPFVDGVYSGTITFHIRNR